MHHVKSNFINTASLHTHYYEAGDNTKPLLVLLHGNVSSADFFLPIMAQISANYHLVAPDMRGYGKSETKPVDARNGVGDFVEDLNNFIASINHNNKKVVLLGWSLGGAVVMQAAMKQPKNIAGLFLISPMSPFGFGASTNKGLDLVASSADFAGSGGGAVNPAFVDSIRTRDGAVPSNNPDGAKANPQNYCITTMNSLYFHAVNAQTLAQRGIISSETEQLFVNAMFSTKLGDDNYPGDTVTSGNWPGMAPGNRGVNNAISAKFCNISAFAKSGLKIPVMWLRGDSDLIVSDTSFVDINNLGKLGFIPNWPGEATHAPQPMLQQMRSVLEAYKSNGGTYEEQVFEQCGHSPHIEYPAKFENLLNKYMAKV